MARLILLALLLGTGAHAQVMQQFNMGLPKPAAACLSFFPQDVLVDMNGNTPGTTVTAAVMGAGTEPAGVTWNAPSAGFTVATSQVGAGLPAAVTIISTSTTRTCGYATQAIALNAATGFSTTTVSFFNGVTQAVFSGFATLPPNQGAGVAKLYDLMVAGGAGTTGTTYSPVFQVNSGTGASCGAYGVEIESSGGTTTHSTCNTAASSYASAMVYWTMWVNWSGSGTSPCSGPCAALNIYDPSTFVQIGSTVSTALHGTDSAGQMYYGNNEFGTFTGTLYQQNMMIDSTNHVWPNVPH